MDILHLCVGARHLGEHAGRHILVGHELPHRPVHDASAAWTDLDSDVFRRDNEILGEQALSA
jgi:hypothetical protein